MVAITLRADLTRGLTNEEIDANMTNLKAAAEAAALTASWAGVTGKPATLAGYGITDAQPVDADLTAIAALAGTSGFLKKTAANTWALDTTAYITASASITGNAATATALQTARTINGVSFNGTTNITIADATKLPLTGGTLTGALIANTNDGVSAIYGGTDGQAWLRGWGIESNRSTVYLRPTANGTATLHVGFSSGSQNWGTINLDATNLYKSGNVVLHAGNYNSYSPTLTGTGASGSWGISISGNAATVTNGVVTTGSYADPAWITSVNYSKLTGTIPTWNQNTTGSAATLTTGRTIAMTGDVTYTSGSFNGSANVTGTATLAASGVTAGTYTKVTVDAKGRVTTGASLAAGDVPTLNQSTTGNSATATTLQTARTLTIGSTGKTFNGSANVAWSLAEIGALGASAKAADSELLDGYNSDRFLRTYADSSMEAGVHGGNLNGTNMQYLLAREQVQNLVAYVAPTSYETWNGSAWVSTTVPTAIFRNKPSNNFGGLTIANGVTKVRFTWLSFGYKFWSTLATAGSTNGNSFRARIYTSSDNVTWVERFVSGYVTDWPGYHVWPTYYGDAAFPHMRIELEFTYANANACTFGDIALWGAYGGYTPLFDWDFSRNITFGGDLQLLDKVLRFDQSGTRSWTARATGGNLDIASGDSAGLLRYNSNTILHAGNYNSYSPTLTGTGASGSWGISVTGNAANVTGTVAIANGGTGQTTRQNAMDALAGAVTSGQYLRGNGTDVVMSAIQAADVPTLNQSTTGNAGSVTNGVYTTGEQTITARKIFSTTNSAIASASGDLSTLEVRSTSTGAAFMAFHRPTLYAAYFGLDSDNVWKVGGWSMGANSYPILHSNNYNTYAPTKTGGGASGSWGISITGSSASTTGNAATVTNGVYTTGSYADPAWLTSLASSKLTGTIDNARLNGGTYTINVSGSSGSTTGNAATATALQTARTINGVSFNGTANITVADSTKLALSGGTMTGAITTPNGAVGINIGDDVRFADRNVANTLYLEGQANNDRGYINFGSTAGTVLGAIAGGALTYNNNVVLHAGNYTSYSPSLTGSGASGSWGISVTGSAATLTTARTINGISFNGSANIKTSEWFHSDRDFAVGTLVTTDINYAVTSGDPFVLEIRGNSYGDAVPYDIQYQGYIYSDTIINHGGHSNGTNITGLVAINVGGNLCFWWPRQSYWNGFNVRVYTAYATVTVNRVTSITSTAKPTSTKEVALSANIRQSLHSSNYNSYSPTLTGVGASGTWGISVTGSAASATGNAATATALQTARTIGGVSFNGTANINLPGVNAAGNQNTTGSAATLTTARTINGTSFNGSANILTTSWGTARTLTIGATGKSVDGSANVAWTAAEMGVLPLSGGSLSGNLTIRNTGPTIFMRDTDNNSAMLHCNSNLMYILRGGNDTESWAQVGGYWPVYWDLTNNNATFGGSIWAAGNITAYSDERVKENWEGLADDFVERLAEIKSGTFDRTDIKKRQAGVSAQSMQKLLPEVVDYHEKEELLSVAYGNAALVSAVELAKDNLKLRARIERLEALVEKLIGD